MLRPHLLRIHEFFQRVVPRIRGCVFETLYGMPFRRIGRQFRLHGGRAISVGKYVSVGDGCWIEAVLSYRGYSYSPRLKIGDHVAISNWTHISCAHEISLGDGCLLGSKIYIGDHNHGSVWSAKGRKIGFPAEMPLEDLERIEIGAGSWICDGAVILPGTILAPGSVVGANSVVKLREERPALIAGAPARVLRYLN